MKRNIRANSWALLITTIALGTVIAGLVIWGITESRAHMYVRTQLDNSYQRQFYRLVNLMENIEIKLSKLPVAQSGELRSRLLMDVWKDADDAQDQLGQLPLKLSTTDSTMKYLNQVSDYCRYLTTSDVRNRNLTDKEITTLNTLHKNCVGLNKEMSEVGQLVLEGDISMAAELENKAEKIDPGSMSGRISKMAETSIDYPSMIYDGPFSDAALVKKQVVTGPAKTEAQCMEFVKKLFGTQNVTRGSGLDSGPILTWGFILDGDVNKTVQITRNGGFLYNYDSYTEATEEKLDSEKLIQRAQDFINRAGYADMTSVWVQRSDGEATVNFVPLQDGILLYPDMIKINVNMETGMVTGADAMQYLSKHIKREIAPAIITETQARAKVFDKLNPNQGRLALAPNQVLGIKLCYEFSGKYEGSMFIVYIDAYTGQEVDIFRVINSDNGEMAM